MRLILQCNHYYLNYENSFRTKKRIGFTNVKKYSLYRKRKWGTGFFNNNPWLQVRLILKEGKKGKLNANSASKFY